LRSTIQRQFRRISLRQRRTVAKGRDQSSSKRQGQPATAAPAALGACARQPQCCSSRFSAAAAGSCARGLLPAAACGAPGAGPRTSAVATVHSSAVPRAQTCRWRQNTSWQLQQQPMARHEVAPRSRAPSLRAATQAWHLARRAVVAHPSCRCGCGRCLLLAAHPVLKRQQQPHTPAAATAALGWQQPRPGCGAVPALSAPPCTAGGAQAPGARGRPGTRAAAAPGTMQSRHALCLAGTRRAVHRCAAQAG
jgi:hypothetical protein